MYLCSYVSLILIILFSKLFDRQFVRRFEIKKTQKTFAR
jgi:hypothetical protein